MTPALIKLHLSVETSPFDHLRIVKIDLHKVLLLGVITIERPERQENDQTEYVQHVSMVSHIFCI